METLIQIGLSNAVAATLLAALVACICCFCRKPAVIHSLWLLVLLKLITPPLFPLEFTWPNPPSSLIIEESPKPDFTTKNREADIQPTPTGKSAVAKRIQAENVPNPQLTIQKETDDVTASSSARTPNTDWLSVVITIWISGSVFWWLLAARRVRKFYRLLRLAYPADDELTQRMENWATRLGLRRRPTVFLVDAAVPPLLWALGRKAYLLLPRQLWQRLTQEQQDGLLLHELAHLRRGDHWVRRLELVVVGMYWWLPIVWLARRRIQEAEEQCCDGWVVWAAPAAATEYAHTLVETIAFLTQARMSVPPGASGSRRTRRLQRRLTMICQKTVSRKITPLAFCTVLLLAVVALPLWPTLASSPQQSLPKTSPNKSPAGNPIVVSPETPARNQSGPNLVSPAPGVEKTSYEDAVAFAQATAQKEEINRRRRHLKDQVELHQAELTIKRAELEVAMVSYEATRANAKRIEGLYKRGAVSVKEYSRVKTSAAIGKAELNVKQAELRKAEVGFQHARNELKLLEKSASTSAQTPAASKNSKKTEDRLRNVEGKLDGLQKQIEELRRVLKPANQPVRRSSTPWLEMRDTHYTKERTIKIPILRFPNGLVDHQNKRIFSAINPTFVQFAVSIDGGDGWNTVSKVSANEKEVTCGPLSDGAYHCRVRYLGRNGDKHILKEIRYPVVIDTTAPEIKLTPQRINGNRVRVDWSITETNLDREGIIMQFKSANDKDWRQVFVRPGNRGSIHISQDRPTAINIRMSVRDLAGNERQTEVAAPK